MKTNPIGPDVSYSLWESPRLISERGSMKADNQGRVGRLGI